MRFTNTAGSPPLCSVTCVVCYWSISITTVKYCTPRGAKYCIRDEISGVHQQLHTDGLFRKPTKRVLVHDIRHEGGYITERTNRSGRIRGENTNVWKQKWSVRDIFKLSKPGCLNRICLSNRRVRWVVHRRNEGEHSKCSKIASPLHFYVNVTQRSSIFVTQRKCDTTYCPNNTKPPSPLPF